MTSRPGRQQVTRQVLLEQHWLGLRRRLRPQSAKSAAATLDLFAVRPGTGAINRKIAHLNVVHCLSPMMTIGANDRE